MNKRFAPVIAAALLLCQGALADSKSTWKGDAEVGLLSTTGNTKTRSFTAKGEIVNNRDRWRHTVKLEALNSAEKGNTTAERYFVSGKSDLKLDGGYIFGLVTYENDRFSGFNYRVAETLGYGHTVIKTEPVTLDLEGGVGARQSRVITTGEEQNEGLIHLSGHLAWKISASALFTQELTSDIGEKATITKSVTALKTQIIGALASKVSFTAEHTSHVPAGVTKTDTETAVTLVYSF